MARLIIRNIGPIKNVDIELNKVNVFIGEQSSGKSTIAKIISFCSWLEKTVNKDNVFFGEGKEAYRRLQTYHHIQSYFREDSVICYLGENLASTLKMVSLIWCLFHKVGWLPWRLHQVDCRVSFLCSL